MRGLQLLFVLCLSVLVSSRAVDRDSAFPGYKEELVACSDKLPEAVCADYLASRMCNTGEFFFQMVSALQATINYTDRSYCLRLCRLCEGRLRQDVWHLLTAAAAPSPPAPLATHAAPPPLLPFCFSIPSQCLLCTLHLPKCS